MKKLFTVAVIIVAMSLVACSSKKAEANLDFTNATPETVVSALNEIVQSGDADAVTAALETIQDELKGTLKKGDIEKAYTYANLIKAFLEANAQEIIDFDNFEIEDNRKSLFNTFEVIKHCRQMQLLQRVGYIFLNLPDHRWLDEVDKSVFSPSFLEVLEKASALHKKHLNEGCLAMDRIDYWYVGQDGCYDDGLQGISLLSENDEIADVEVKYKNCDIEKHKMRLVYSDGQWLCDNWDNMKEGLLEDMKDLSMDTHTEGSLKLDIFRCVVDSIRGRVGPGIEYEEDEDWWSNVERGDEVRYLNNTTNDYRECLISGYRGSPCIIWIPKDCLEPTGEQEEVLWSLKELEQFGYVK